mmetsp:Transcript_19979/g.17710  ORF Transcript_19979/g.17710 Transcript_19979/m.17710 type:complete len:350 (-) Transcript_19979:28-1077(-)
MSTQPGYQQMQSEGGEGDNAPPPAFNPDAVSPNDYAQSQNEPPTTSYGAIPSQSVQYVNSQQPPQQSYISQPQPQQPIRQQIIQQSQYNPQQPVQYVNQYGQPIQQQQQQQQQQGVSPVVIVPPQQVQQQTIIYAQQAQNQNQALIQPVAYKPINDYRNPSDKDRQKRFVAAMGGSLAMILLIIAMSTHKLASGSVDGYNIDCQILYLHTDNYSSDIANNFAYYSDFCWNWDTDVKWINWADTDSGDWCDTWRGASYWISCIVFGCLFTCLGTCWVQPVCTMERCCCPVTCPRVMYFFGLLLCILGNVLWTTNDQVCLPSDAFNLHVGISVDLVAGCCVVIFVTMFCAK